MGSPSQHPGGQRLPHSWDLGFAGDDKAMISPTESSAVPRPSQLPCLSFTKAKPHPLMGLSFPHLCHREGTETAGTLCSRHEKEKT